MSAAAPRTRLRQTQPSPAWAYFLVPDGGAGGLERAREHRDDLEDLAGSDLRSAKWARAILNELDGGEPQED